MTGADPKAAGGESPAVPSRPVDRERSAWQDACTAAQLFAVDPAGLCGVAVIAGPGFVREAWFDGLRGGLASATPVRRLPPHIEDDRLLGGVDLIATIETGRPVLQRGVLAEADGGIVVIPMAERLSPSVTARIAAALDQHELAIEREGIAGRVAARIGVVAFDEGASIEEHIPTALLQRFAFHIDLREIGPRALDPGSMDGAAVAAARARLGLVERTSDDIIEALVGTAAAFGIESVVAPLLALRAARAAAALAGRHVISKDDAVLAARLVLAPRARIAPAVDTEAAVDGSLDESELPEQEADGERATPPADRAEAEADLSEPPSLEDILLAAVQTALPDGLLATLKAGPTARGQVLRREGAGLAQASLLRGRPVGVRVGPIRPGVRVALVDTLRAAAPWQAVRRSETPVRSGAQRIELRREDFRIKKFSRRRESTIVFCVDASGSAAFHRLAESKGAVELLLGQAYVSRTHAALIAFRGKGAELLLPPTRSLSRAKSLLANLPGGGGTPLASGIDAAVSTALGERARGRAPLVVILTDGHANIGRDGLAARPRASQEALAAARLLAAQRIAAVFVDTSPRAHGGAAELAAAMGARYVALPYVEAAAVRDVVLASSPALGRNAMRAR